MNDPYEAYINQNSQTSSSVSSNSNDPYTSYVKENTQPRDVNIATQLGEDPKSIKYNGYCQAFVDDVLGNQDRSPSASDAWNKYQSKGIAVQGTAGIEPGDLIYFQDPNDPNGHVGFYSGKNKFISATEENPDKPVQNHDINAWHDLTGQQILGYVKNPENLPSIGGSQ